MVFKFNIIIDWKKKKLIFLIGFFSKLEKKGQKMIQRDKLIKM